MTGYSKWPQTSMSLVLREAVEKSAIKKSKSGPILNQGLSFMARFDYLREAVGAAAPTAGTGGLTTVMVRPAKETRRRVLRQHTDLFPTTSEVPRFVAEVLARDTRDTEQWST